MTTKATTNKVYGYARISTKKQSIERQIKSIKAYNENAIIFEETFTGTKVVGRKEFKKLMDIVKEGDTIIFDSVSRMSRNAEEGYKIYMDLYKRGINLVFLNEMTINTDTYKNALLKNIEMTNTNIDFIIEGVNKFLESLAKEQILKAFEQAEKEVVDLSTRTSKTLQVLKDRGVVLGRKEGTKVTTKKSIQAKKRIQELSKDFNGSNTDKDVIAILRITRNTYYKYKKELVQELQQKEYEQ
jgi:DNA invertase Pin-like site-specific DNA recombinase|nr:recombinase family protein [uncultured Romboutsia sp.]